LCRIIRFICLIHIHKKHPNTKWSKAKNQQTCLIVDATLDRALGAVVVVVVVGPFCVSSNAGDQRVPCIVIHALIELDLHDLTANGIKFGTNHQSFALAIVRDVDSDNVTGEEFVFNSHDSSIR